MRIRDKEPKDLDHALRIALLAQEAHTVERVIEEIVEAPVKNKEYKARRAQSFEEFVVYLRTSSLGHTNWKHPLGLKL